MKPTLVLFILLAGVFVRGQSIDGPCPVGNCRLVDSFVKWDYSDLDSNVLLAGDGPTQICGDGDCYVMILPECPTDGFHLRIFDRWGTVLFETTERGHYWNAAGKDEGVYIWMLEGTHLNGCTFDYKGHLTLLNDNEPAAEPLIGDSCIVYVPNVVTPDCDAIDCDHFLVYSDCEFKTYLFTLYSRWGEVLFESNDPKKGFWAREFEDGVYIWKLEGEFENGQKIDMKGNVTVLK